MLQQLGAQRGSAVASSGVSIQSSKVPVARQVSQWLVLNFVLVSSCSFISGCILTCFFLACFLYITVMILVLQILLSTLLH